MEEVHASAAFVASGLLTQATPSKVTGSKSPSKYLTQGDQGILWEERHKLYSGAGRCAVNVPGDGSCFKHAVERCFLVDFSPPMIVNGSLLNHNILEELESRWEFYIPFFSEGPRSSGDCIQDMRAAAISYLVDNQWRQEVVDVVVQATANAMKIGIGVFSRKRREDPRSDTVQLLHFGPPGLQKTIYLELDCGHYQAVLKNSIEFDPKGLTTTESQFFFNQLGYTGTLEQMAKEASSGQSLHPPDPPSNSVQEEEEVKEEQKVSAPASQPPDRWDTPPPQVQQREEQRKRETSSNVKEEGRPYNPDEPVQLVAKDSRAYFPFGYYSSLQPEVVDKCPDDINGFRFYRINFEDGDNPNQLAGDRRRFKLRSSRGKNLPTGATRKVGWCGGSLVCQNEKCDFYRLSTERNTNNWDKATQEMKGAKNCYSCGCEAHEVECFGRKAVEIFPADKYMLLYHINWHSCSLKRLAGKNDEYLTSISEKNPGLSAGDLTMQDMMEAMAGGDIDEVYRRGSILADTRRLRYLQQKARGRGLAHGKDSLEALAKHTQIVSRRDHFLMYKSHMMPGSSTPTYVFKTSREAVSLAVEMDVAREKDSPMQQEEAYFDGQHSRCKGYVTLGLYTCIKAMKKIITLARMECASECQSSIHLFFHFFNQALQDYTGDSEVFFNPIKIITDAHSANENGIAACFGKEYQEQKQIGCQLHYQNNVKIHAAKLPTQYRAKFIQLAMDAMHSRSASEYKSLISQLDIMATMFPVIQHHVRWWDIRRYHHVDYFRGLQFASTNLAEAGHASFHSSTPLWLVQAAQQDACKLICQGWKIKQFLAGDISSDGRGPNQAEAEKRAFRTQRRIAAGSQNILDRAAEYESQRPGIPQTSSAPSKLQHPVITLDDMEEEMDSLHVSTFTAPLREKHKPSEEARPVKSRKQTGKKTAATKYLESQKELEEILMSSQQSEKEAQGTMSQIEGIASRNRSVQDTAPLLRRYLRRNLINCYPSAVQCPIYMNRPTLIPMSTTTARKCLSCNGVFSAQDRATPPFDMCFRLQCHRPWRNRRDQVVDKIVPGYIHCSRNCLQAFDPRIQPEDALIPPETLDHCQRAHLQYFGREGFMKTIYSAGTVSTLLLSVDLVCLVVCIYLLKLF